MKKYSFFFHYNKPESQRTGSPKLSVHFRGACYVVSHIDISDVKHLYTKHRKTQPRCVIAGKASKIQLIEDNKVEVYESKKKPHEQCNTLNRSFTMVISG